MSIPIKSRARLIMGHKKGGTMYGNAPYRGDVCLMPKTGNPISLRLDEDTVGEIAFLEGRRKLSKTKIIETAVREMAEREREKMRMVGEEPPAAPEPLIPSPGNVEDFVDTEQAAVLLGVNPQTVREYGLRGRLPRYRSPRPGRGGGYVYLRSDVLAFQHQPATVSDSEFVTVHEASKILGRRNQTIHAMIASGRLTDYRAEESRFPRLKRADVEALGELKPRQR